MKKLLVVYVLLAAACSLTMLNVAKRVGHKDGDVIYRPMPVPNKAIGV